MERSKDDMLQQAAQTFLAHEQALAAAIAYAETAQQRNNVGPEVWMGLGSALQLCPGRLSRKPFLEWSARSLKRSLVAGATDNLEDCCHEWLMDYSSEICVDDLEPLAQADLPALLAFLDIDINIFPNAISKLPEEARGFVVICLGEQGNPRFLPVMLSALRGVWGDFNVRASLKRLGRYGDTPEIRETLEIVAFSERADHFQPYLRVALDRIDPEWALDVLQEAAQNRFELGENSCPPGTRPWWKFWD